MEALSRKEQKERTRLRLVEQAETLFSRHGIGATTTADIAKSLNVSHGTVFLHFPTREDLIQSVVERFGERLQAELERAMGDESSLRDLLKAHLQVLAEFEDFYFRLISEAQNMPPHIRSIAFSLNASLSYRFFRAAQPLMKEGKFKKLEQIQLFNTWIALVHYYILNRDLFADRTPILAEVGDDLMKLFLNLLKA